MSVYKHSIIPDLNLRAQQGKPIKVGLLGCGSMGGDLIEQMRFIPGMEIVAIADRRPPNIKRCLSEAGHDESRIVYVNSSKSANITLDQGNIAITDDLSLIPDIDKIEAVIDATGKPSVGAIHGDRSIEAGKHLVMMNVESDVTVGAYLSAKAQKQGVVYTVGAGDEPTSTLELVHFVQNMGFQVIAAGKGKNNPLNRRITPSDLIAEAKQKKMNPRVLSEFIDGTKTMVEMTALANATGLPPDCSGMHGPACDLAQLHHTLVPQKDGGILSQSAVVDYSVGKDVAPGVFVVAHIDSPRLCARMDYLALGEGPYYTFYRPYHLTSLEVPLSVARAVLYGVADLSPKATPTAEACGRAKSFIQAGETLEGIAEKHYYGWIMEYTQAKTENVLPLGLLEGSVAKRDIQADEVLSTENCQADTASSLYQLREKQDKILS